MVKEVQGYGSKTQTSKKSQMVTCECTENTGCKNSNGATKTQEKRKPSSTEKKNIERCNNLYNGEDTEYMKRLYNESELIIINNS